MSGKVTSVLASHVINLLRESKTEILERLKLFQHYGFFGGFFPNFKRLHRPSLNNGYGNDLPDELSIALERIRALRRIEIDKVDNPPRITFISHAIPRADSTSSALRLCYILKILLQRKYKINFLYCSRLWNEPKYVKFFDDDIRFTYLPLNTKDYIKFLTDKNPDYIWITELWRLNYVEFMTKLCARLRQGSTSSQLIVDTIDFHFKEFHRKYELTQNPDDLIRANDFLRHEKVLYRQADTVFAISEDEKKDIQDKISDIKRIEVIPNIHDISDTTRPFSKRRNICFVGHFGNKHNVDAAIYFIEKIFRLILEKNPDVEFHLLGNGAEKHINNFRSPNVKVIGGLKYLHEALQNYRLFVCPMTYGAGMKGKIGGAVAAGVPVVTTAIGAEGFPFTDGEECFIADTPEKFAKRCNQCLTDRVLWHHLSVKSRLMMAENFSPAVIAEKFGKIFSDSRTKRADS